MKHQAITKGKNIKAIICAAFQAARVSRSKTSGASGENSGCWLKTLRSRRFPLHHISCSPLLFYCTESRKMPGLKRPWKKNGDATALGDADGKLCVFLCLPLPMEKSISHSDFRTLYNYFVLC